MVAWGNQPLFMHHLANTPKCAGLFRWLLAFGKELVTYPLFLGEGRVEALRLEIVMKDPPESGEWSFSRLTVPCLYMMMSPAVLWIRLELWATKDVEPSPGSGLCCLLLVYLAL